MELSCEALLKLDHFIWYQMGRFSLCHANSCGYLPGYYFLKLVFKTNTSDATQEQRQS